MRCSSKNPRGLRSDQFGGTLNLETVLEYLVERGHIPADHSVNDVELGNEVLDRSSGVFWLKSFGVQFRWRSSGRERFVPYWSRCGRNAISEVLHANRLRPVGLRGPSRFTLLREPLSCCLRE